ncbi:MAG: hypothetical protein ACRCWL_12010 [Aeromonas sp.]
MAAPVRGLLFVLLTQSALPAGALVQMDAVMSNAESTPPQG